MSPQSLSLSQKLSAFFARKIVWLWPQETKEWGLAFEAELPEIATPFASARWVMGEAALLARDSLRHFLKGLWRPLGVTAPSDPSEFSGDGGPAVGLFVYHCLYVRGRYYFWVGLTSVLSLVLFFLVYRMVAKRGNS